MKNKDLRIRNIAISIGVASMTLLIRTSYGKNLFTSYFMVSPVTMNSPVLDLKTSKTLDPLLQQEYQRIKKEGQIFKKAYQERDNWNQIAKLAGVNHDELLKVDSCWRRIFQLLGREAKTLNILNKDLLNFLHANPVAAYLHISCKAAQKGKKLLKVNQAVTDRITYKKLISSKCDWNKFKKLSLAKQEANHELLLRAADGGSEDAIHHLLNDEQNIHYVLSSSFSNNNITWHMANNIRDRLITIEADGPEKFRDVTEYDKYLNLFLEKRKKSYIKYVKKYAAKNSGYGIVHQFNAYLTGELKLKNQSLDPETAFKQKLVRYWTIHKQKHDAVINYLKYLRKNWIFRSDVFQCIDDLLSQCLY